MKTLSSVSVRATVLSAAAIASFVIVATSVGIAQQPPAAAPGAQQPAPPAAPAADPEVLVLPPLLEGADRDVQDVVRSIRSAPARGNTAAAAVAGAVAPAIESPSTRGVSIRRGALPSFRMATCW